MRLYRKISFSIVLLSLANANASHRLIGLLLSCNPPSGKVRLALSYRAFTPIRSLFPPQTHWQYKATLLCYSRTQESFSVSLFVQAGQTVGGLIFHNVFLVLGVRNFKKVRTLHFCSGGLSNFQPPLSPLGLTTYFLYSTRGLSPLNMLLWGRCLLLFTSARGFHLLWRVRHFAFSVSSFLIGL